MLDFFLLEMPKPQKYSYKEFRRGKRDLSHVVEFSLELLLKSIPRKLARRGRLKASTTIFVCPGAFVPYMRCFESSEEHPIDTDFKTYSLGRGHLAVAKATALFTNFESLTYHLRQPFGPSKNIVNYFTKSLSQGATASAVVSPDKPCKMEYDARRGRLVFSFYYEVRNRYGNISA